jgi:hypothetical protein
MCAKCEVAPLTLLLSWSLSKQVILDLPVILLSIVSVCNSSRRGFDFERKICEIAIARIRKFAIKGCITISDSGSSMRSPTFGCVTRELKNE